MAVLGILRSARLCVNALRSPAGLMVRCSSSDIFEYDYKKTEISVQMLDNEDDMLYVQSYSQIGFKLNSGVRVIGPCAVFARSILHWNVKGAHDIDEQSLSLFTILEPKIDLLIIGKGDRTASIDPKVYMYLKSKKVNVEILPTDQALATFNFLNAEKRYVAGAFIPPQYMYQDLDDDSGMDEAMERTNVYQARLDYHQTPTDSQDEFKDLQEHFDAAKGHIKKKVIRQSDDSKEKP